MPQTDSKSSSGQEQQQTAPQMSPYSFPFPQQFEDDSIDLYELCITLWKRKWLVIAVTVVAAIGSVVYAMQQPRIYKAEALLLPPKGKDVRSMNIYEKQNLSEDDTKSIVTGNSASEVFSKFKQNLYSRTIHKKFIQEKSLIKLLAPERTAENSDEGVYTVFAGLIKLGEINGITSLSIELKDPVIAAQWVNDFIEFVDRETIIMMVEDSQNSIANQVRDIEYTIASKRQMAKQRREDTITQYQEAASIAQKLGVMDRVDSTNIVQNNQLNITTSNIPLYFRGYRALNTEITYLKSRLSDDPYISGLRDLQERLALLRSIKFNEKKMSAVYIDQAAYPPNSPIKLRRGLIVSVATLAGLFSGIFLAFFIEFVQNQKRKKHSD